MTSTVDDRDVQFMVIETNGRNWIDPSDDKRMAALGRAVVQLFLTQAQPETAASPATLFGAVDVKKNIESSPVEEVARRVLAPQSQKPPAAQQPQDQKTLEGYQQQIRLLMDAIKQERQLLDTQEKIQLLQQVSSRGAVFVGEDPKIAIVNRIKNYEKQIKEVQSKLDELQQPLHDIKG